MKALGQSQTHRKELILAIVAVMIPRNQGRSCNRVVTELDLCLRKFSEDQGREGICMIIYMRDRVLLGRKCFICLTD